MELIWWSNLRVLFTLKRVSCDVVKLRFLVIFIQSRNASGFFFLYFLKYKLTVQFGAIWRWYDDPIGGFLITFKRMCCDVVILFSAGREVILILHPLGAIREVHRVTGGVKVGLRHLLGGVEDIKVGVGVNHCLHCLGQEVQVLLLPKLLLRN